MIKKIEEKENIETIFNTIIKEVEGDSSVEKIIIENRETGEIKEIKVNGVFVEYGYEPNSYLAEELGVKLSEKGRIVVDENMRTNVEGFFAAGDVTTGSGRFDQVITAAAEGAIAARSAHDYITR